MNQLLKTRLVGAAVLMIAAGLLWPLLFDFDDSRQSKPLQLDIPDASRAVAKAKQSQEFASLNTGDDNKRQRSQSSAAKAKTSVEKKPEKPKLSVVQKSEPVNSVKKTTSDKHSSDDNAPATDSAEIPRLDSRGIPVAWVVQVGTFSRWDNAERFRTELINSDLNAYIQPETSRQPGPYRVLIGPLLTYDEAKKTSAAIHNKHRIQDTFIRKFGRH